MRYAKVELEINVMFPVEPVVDEVKYESLIFLNNILLQNKKSYISKYLLIIIIISQTPLTEKSPC